MSKANKLYLLAALMLATLPGQLGCKPVDKGADEQETESDNEDASVTDADSGSGGGEGTENETETKNDSVTENENDHQYYQIKYQTDVGDWTFGDQGIFTTYSYTLCEYEQFNVVHGVSPFIFLQILFHDGYDLVGNHVPRVSAPEDAGYRQGFFAGYSNHEYIEVGGDAQYILAQSGDVRVFDEGDERYKVTYDIVFNEEIHETGEWIMEPCGDPILDY